MVLRTFGLVGLLLQLHAAEVLAQCSIDGTTTINSRKQASSLASCSTFTGSIAIATSTTDDIALDGVRTLTGDIVATNATQIKSLSADSLETIKGALNLITLPRLSTLNFPKLTQANIILWDELGALSVLSFDAGVSAVSMINIQNTALSSLLGITQFKTADSVYVANNPSLQDIELLLENFTTSIMVKQNNPGLSLTFPSLLWTFNLTASNCKSVYMPKLAAVNGSLALTNNTFTNFGLPELKSIGGSLSFTNNSDLTNLSLPALTQVGGGLQVSDNAALNTLDFDTIRVIAGALKISGNFTNISLSGIEDVRGALLINSTSNISSTCQELQNEQHSRVIKGMFSCNYSIATPSSSTSSTTPSAPGASNSTTSISSIDNGTSLSTGAKAGIGIGAAIGGLVLIGLCVMLLLRRHRRTTTSTPDEKDDTGEVVFELPSGKLAQELNTESVAQELSGPNKDQAHELHAVHGTSELAPQELPGSPMRPSASHSS